MNKTNRIISIAGLVAASSFAFIRCGDPKEEGEPSDSSTDTNGETVYGAEPIEMKLAMQEDQEICGSPITLNATLEWGDWSKSTDCINIHFVQYGCDEDIGPLPQWEGDEVIWEINPDAGAPSQFGCVAGITRSIAIKKGNETVFETASVGDPIQHEFDPLYTFCADGEPLHVTLTMDTLSPGQNVDTLTLPSDNDSVISDFEQIIYYTISENGCVVFPSEEARGD